MKRMTFRESDIPSLDFIIDKILETDWKVYSNELVDAGLLSQSDTDLENKFESLLAIIDSYGCAKVNPAKNVDNGANAEKNGMTAKFKTDGGFMTAFKQLQADSAKDKETKLKEQLEIENLKLQNENMEYSKTIRNQESKIRKLDLQLKKIEFIQKWKWLIGLIIFIAAFVLANLKFLQPLIQAIKNLLQ